MKTLLFLVHRIPYPPNKGDKVRSYQILKYLSAHFRVRVGAFVDADEDWPFRSELEALCEEVFLVPLARAGASVRSLVGLFRHEPLTLPYYRDRRMSDWVRGKVTEGVDSVLVFSSSMAQYAEAIEGHVGRRVIDFVDLDSEKWGQYGALSGGVSGAIYRREARLLAEYECKIARRLDSSVFVSAVEAQPLLRRCRDVDGRLHWLCNGVDHEYFDPNADLSNPYGPGEKVVVFTGAMDYGANADAVCWFAEEVWPAVAEAELAARFYIVGARPKRAVRKLGRIAGIHVTGTVDDVRPYLKFATVSVAPMRIARGVQNKVLEAMAMGLPVIATSAAAEGLSAEATSLLEPVDSSTQMTEAVLRWLTCADRAQISRRSRQAILQAHDWTRNLHAIRDLLDPAAAQSPLEARA